MKLFLVSIVGAALTSSPSWAATVSTSKVAELTAHRIDRLVSLGKIDNGFLTSLESLEVTAVNQPPVAYKVRVSQTQPANAPPIQLDLSFDKDGKPLAYQPVAGGVAGPDPQWTGIDAVGLSENALHYVLENATDPKLKKFSDGLSTFTLVKGDLNGATVARGRVQSSLTTEKLEIYLQLDGTFISALVVP